MDAAAKKIEDTSERKRTADLLARAEITELTAAWDAVSDKPEFQTLRGPESGLVMVRGRIGGGGAPFNLGEVTVSRASIRLSSGTVGHAHALGTDREKARLAAVFDALWVEDGTRAFVEAHLLAVIEQRISREQQQEREEAAATRVDFFTMVRGDD